MNHTVSPKAFRLTGRLSLSTVTVKFRRKNSHLKVRDGVMLSVCVSETVPLGLCHSALDCLTSMREYVGWIVHASQGPPGQIGVLCAYICIMITHHCVCFLSLPFISLALFLNNDAMLGITVGFKHAD